MCLMQAPHISNSVQEKKVTFSLQLQCFHTHMSQYLGKKKNVTHTAHIETIRPHHQATIVRIIRISKTWSDWPNYSNLLLRLRNTSSAKVRPQRYTPRTGISSNAAMRIPTRAANHTPAANQATTYSEPFARLRERSHVIHHWYVIGGRG